MVVLPFIDLFLENKIIPQKIKRRFKNLSNFSKSFLFYIQIWRPRVDLNHRPLAQTEDSFAKNKKELETYLKKNEDKVNDKFVDLFMIDLYKEFESWLDEMNEIEKRGLDKKCNSIKAKITEILEQLEEVNFDYVDNGYFYYKRNASNKTKRHYKSLLDYVDEVNNFIKTFNTENEYNTIEEDIDSDEIKYIRFMYQNYAELTHILKNEKYDKALKRIIYFLKFERPRYLHNKFIDELERFKTISFLIIDKKYEEAYEETMKFIKQNEKWFVRASQEDL